MAQTTKEKIVKLIEKKYPLSATDIIAHFPINRTILFRHLKDLREQGFIKKIGSWPKVVYMPADKETKTDNDDFSLFSFHDIQRLDQQYLFYESDGTELVWFQWFVSRCRERNLIPYEQYQHYKSIVQSIDQQKNKSGLISVYKKLQQQNADIYLDEIYVSDSYQLGQFGKSPLGSLAFYAKQSQNRSLAKQIIQRIDRGIQRLIKEKNIEAICFAPISIQRKIQLMDILKKELTIHLPLIELYKLFPNNVVIPQKSIKWTTQRIKNALNTIFIKTKWKKYTNVLLIDDFIASGATVNISAKKIKEAWLAKKVIAYAIVGNIDLSYEVINEV